MIRKRFATLWLILFGLVLFTGPAAAEDKLLKNLSRIQHIPVLSRELRWLAADLEKGLRFYGSLTDYQAMFTKVEISGQKRGELEQIYLKFEKPWKIYMEWLNTSKKGLQVVYEKGKHDGKLAVHQPGLLLGLAPVIFLDQNSPWVKAGSESFDIEDAGIGTFLVNFSNAVIRGYREKKIRVHFRHAVKGAGVVGDKADVTFSGSKPGGGYFAYRVLVTFDARNKLPVKIQLFDWHKRPIGIYAYKNLRVNVGSGEDFNRRIDPNLLKVYRS